MYTDPIHLLANKWRSSKLFSTRDIGLANRNPKYLASLLQRLGVTVHEQIYVKIPGFSRGRFYDLVVKIQGKWYGIEVKGSPAAYANRVGIQAAKDEVASKGGLELSGSRALDEGISGQEFGGVFRLLFPFAGW